MTGRYPAYKPTALPWLPEVPEHWEVKKLSRACRERQEKNTGMKVSEVLSLSYGRIILRDMDNGGLVPDSFETYQIVHPGNIILRLTDLQNDQKSLRVGLVRQKGIITSAYVCLETQLALNSNYAALLLHAYDVNKVFYTMGSGVRQSMSFEHLKGLPILVPPPTEQAAIVAFIERQMAELARLVGAKRRLLELLDEQRAAVIARAVTLGLDPNAPRRKTGLPWLPEVPEGWEVKKLKFVADYITRGDAPEYVEEGHIKVINQACVYPDGLRLQNVKFQSETGISQWKGRLYCHDILVNATGTGTLGRVALFEEPEKADFMADGHVTIVRDTKSRFYPRYLFYYLSLGQSWITAFASVGSTNQIELQRGEFGNLPVPLPPLAEQAAIVAFIERETAALEATKARIRRELELLEEWKTALISAAVTGRLRVDGVG